MLFTKLLNDTQLSYLKCYKVSLFQASCIKLLTYLSQEDFTLAANIVPLKFVYQHFSLNFNHLATCLDQDQDQFDKFIKQDK